MLPRGWFIRSLCGGGRVRDAGRDQAVAAAARRGAGGRISPLLAEACGGASAGARRRQHTREAWSRRISSLRRRGGGRTRARARGGSFSPLRAAAREDPLPPARAWARRVCGEVRVVEAPGARSGAKTVAMYAGYVDSVHERWTGDNQVGARARRGLLAVGSGAVGRRCPPYLAVGPRASSVAGVWWFRFDAAASDSSVFFCFLVFSPDRETRSDARFYRVPAVASKPSRGTATSPYDPPATTTTRPRVHGSDPPLARCRAPSLSRRAGTTCSTTTSASP